MRKEIHDKIQEIVSNTDFSKVPQGVDSYFVKINSTVGLKLYDLPTVRNNFYKKQVKAYKLGFAPYAYGVIDVKTSFGYNFGYLTRVVKMVNRYGLRQEREDGYEKMRILLKELSKCKIQSYDNHLGNFGIDDFGKMVIIDLGDVYFYQK
jgi:hypothetical protein